MIYATREARLITGFRQASTAPVITHLQFTDDSLLFGAAKENKVKNMIAMLRCYEAVSSLKVNVFKSSLMGIAVELQVTHIPAYVMGCRVGDIPTTYLGLPLTLGNVLKSLWSPMVERVEHKLDSWRARYLSLGRRINQSCAC